MELQLSISNCTVLLCTTATATKWMLLMEKINKEVTLNSQTNKKKPNTQMLEDIAQKLVF